MNWDTSGPRIPKNIHVQPKAEVSLATPEWQAAQSKQVQECIDRMRDGHQKPEHLRDVGYAEAAIQAALEAMK